MNLQKFTQKSLEAIQNAQSMAIEYGNPQMDQQHLLVTLLTQDEGLIPQLMQKMNVNVNTAGGRKCCQKIASCNWRADICCSGLGKNIDCSGKIGRKYDR